MLLIGTHGECIRELLVAECTRELLVAECTRGLLVAECTRGLLVAECTMGLLVAECTSELLVAECTSERVMGQVEASALAPLGWTSGSSVIWGHTLTQHLYLLLWWNQRNSRPQDLFS